MKSYRKYGSAPYKIAVIHGGPGAPGEMAPVARWLAMQQGVLEPLQTADSLAEQVAELRSVLEAQVDPPLVLIGFSWGAWLSLITTAEYPELVKQLILISTPAFENRYERQTLRTRLDNLTSHQREELQRLLAALKTAPDRQQKELFARLGALTEQADSYALQEHDSEVLAYQYNIFKKVWPAAQKLRASGELLNYARRINCPVSAIHGDYDPHPAAGVEGPLRKILKNFRFLQLKKCGHKPWIERYAKADFYPILSQELGPGPCQSR